MGKRRVHQANTNRSLFDLGIFYGALIAMTLYNLFLYFSLHHRSYLYYVLVISGSIFSNAAMNGLGFQYIWQDLPWFNHRSAIVFIHFGTLLVFYSPKVFSIQIDIILDLKKSVY